MHLVFADANVLYSRTLRDWALMLSRESERFAVISSRDCLVEVLANIREKNPGADGGQINHVHELITGTLHDLITDYPGGAIAGMPDEKDWHVVHAATAAGANILVTENMKDFAPVADSLPFDLYSPDDLFDLIWKNDPQAVEAVTKKQVRYWVDKREEFEAEGKPAPKTLVDALKDAGAPQFAMVIEQTLRKLSGKPSDTKPQADGEPNADPVVKPVSASV